MLCLASLVLVTNAPLAAPANNLLPNPGFEQVADDRPADWSFHNFQTGGLAWVEDGGRDSARCVALQSRDETERIAWRAMADLPAGTAYVAAGGWYRTTGLTPQPNRGAAFRVHFHGPVDGRVREIGLETAFFPPADNWTQTPEPVFIVPEGTTRIELQVFNWLQTGVTRWDDVWVRPATAAEFAARPSLGPATPPKPLILQAENATYDAARAEVVEQESFATKQGVALRAGLESQVDDPDAAPDLVFDVTAPEAGRYRIVTQSAVDQEGAELMLRARGKQDSLYLKIVVGDSRPTRRVVFVPWARPQLYLSTLGKFTFSGQPEQVRIWLPAHVRLDEIRLLPYNPPAVPEKVQNWTPTVVPPATRPRLWVNAESLPQVRANLTKGENAAIWQRVKAAADKPFEYQVEPGTEVSYNASLETAASNRAFAWLMTGEAAYARQAIDLLLAYLPAVEFGNLLDITREIGRAIYNSALVYDWCYDQMTPDEREVLRANLMRLADDMEMGWPPFLQTVVNGHGNEAQLNRDLLSMSIALYDEDPVPYQLCAYRILEELVPMRKFEYQSPRHNQGVSYGPYRYNWDLHAAWLFRRMLGQPVFDDNLGGVYYQWLYMRVPNHRALRDGDGFSDGAPANLGQATLLNYAYTGDPIVKWDYERVNGLARGGIMDLLLNDPDLAPAPEGLSSLPLTKDFGPILGSMIARTGWNMGRNTGDVVVEVKGGGYAFGNHQHPDAGSFQIYYRGLQAVDLGQYKFYGTPYDSNFTKRTISHSALLVVDPDEKFAGAEANDGGSRSMRRTALSPEQVLTDPQFANGTILSSSFGPDPIRPAFSHFSVDLTSTYTEKIRQHVRSFSFLNLGDAAHPATLIILDHLNVANPAFKKYWQVNTIQTPEQTADGVVLHNSDLGQTGRVDLQMFLPAPADRTLEVLSGPDSTNVFGKQYVAPYPDRAEADGHRLMFSPTADRDQETFLTVLTMSDEGTEKLPAALSETDAAWLVTIADRAVVLPKAMALTDQPVTFTLPAGAAWQVVATALTPGTWHVAGGDLRYNLTVEAGQHTAFVTLPAGSYTLTPGAAGGAQTFRSDFTPAVSEAIAEQVVLGGTPLADVRTRRVDGVLYVPAEPVATALGVTCAATAAGLELGDGQRTAAFTDGGTQFTVNGQPFALVSPARRVDGTWLLPAGVLAAFSHRALEEVTDGNLAVYSAEPLPWPAGLLWIESAQEPDIAGLHGLLIDQPGRTDYWAAEGQNVGFQLCLQEPARFAGVSIRWHQGNTRTARFAIETSADGQTWQRVFEGQSSGKTVDLESYRFTAPAEGRWVRFVGFGNSANAWNSLVHFRLDRAA